jgi:hypothetical protein
MPSAVIRGKEQNCHPPESVYLIEMSTTRSGRAQTVTTRRIQRELKTVRVMIELYCRGHHSKEGRLCDACGELWDYTQMRVERCPFGQEKPTCVNCTVHCFHREMRFRIQAVMRYAGPKMPLRHPVLSFFHLMDGRRPSPRKTRKLARGRGS